MLHAIIMAGGSGTRFWPSSRAKLPKQLLPLAGSETLLQDTVGRLQGLVPPEQTLIVTNMRLTEAVQKQLPELPPTAIVGEPCKRDTAPCIGLAALLVLQQDADATMGDQRHVGPRIPGRSGRCRGARLRRHNVY